MSSWSHSCLSRESVIACRWSEVFHRWWWSRRWHWMWWVNQSASDRHRLEPLFIEWIDRIGEWSRKRFSCQSENELWESLNWQSPMDRQEKRLDWASHCWSAFLQRPDRWHQENQSECHSWNPLEYRLVHLFYYRWSTSKSIDSSSVPSSLCSYDILEFESQWRGKRRVLRITC